MAGDALSYFPAASASAAPAPGWASRLPNDSGTHPAPDIAVCAACKSLT
ncbi:hypothetical protein [Mycobacterium sp.]